MLITTQFKTNEVVTFKLTSGEEVVGRLKSINDDSYTLIKPMTFLMGPQGLGLVPFVFSAPQDADIELTKISVNVMIKTDESVAKQYLQQTTGLVI